jgi:hypothetical protein
MNNVRIIHKYKRLCDICKNYFLLLSIHKEYEITSFSK